MSSSGVHLEEGLGQIPRKRKKRKTKFQKRKKKGKREKKEKHHGAGELAPDVLRKYVSQQILHKGAQKRSRGGQKKIK
jgi:hypothetical protein